MEKKATFGAGCFWGVEAAFRQLDGVTRTRVGYSGGKTENPTYEDVCSHTTGHAEVVEVTYDPERISYDELLDVFWAKHDPTQLNRQGPDVGTQYRSAVFYRSDDQKRLATDYITQLTKDKIFKRPIVTEVTQLNNFYAAEAYHQNYFAEHPYQPYIVVNDAPKVAHLKAVFPGLYRN